MMDKPNINLVLAERVRRLRASRGLSLASLADQCGVSRSMLSLIERGESNASAVLLERVATGLGVPLAALFDQLPKEVSVLARRSQQLSWCDSASGYTRRNVSPPGVSPIHIVEVSFPARARVTYETAHRTPAVHQQIWMLDGTIDVTLGETHYRLDEGDCLAMQLDQPVMYYNPGKQAARYAVILTTQP
jgi:transcriptional regulator with XRE-family HTH domain